MRKNTQDSASTRNLAHMVLGLREDKDFFENRYHKVNRLYLVIIGLWPNGKTRFNLIQKVVYLFLVGSFIYFQLCKFFTTEFTVDLLIDVVAPLLFCVISLVKYVTNWINSEYIINILETVKDDWYSITDLNELRILQKVTEEGKFYIMCESTCCYVGTILFLSLQYIPYALDFILPLNESRPNYHPFVAEYFVDSEEYFLPILVHMQICITLSITLVVATDAPIMTFLLHTSGIFNIMGYRLEHLYDGISSAEDANNHSTLYAKLISIVRLHICIKERLNKNIRGFSWSYIIQMVLVVIAITGLLLQLHKALSTLDNMGFLLLTTCRVIGHFLVVFLNVIPAQRLTDCSSNLFTDAYSGRWYNAPLESRKLLLIIMAATVEPYKVSAGNLIYMSFETFASIVQMTFSYFTMIHSIEE